MTTGHPIVARLYDPVMAVGERTVLRSHRSYLADCSGRVLDIGAGTGAMFPYLTDPSIELTAVEPDPYMRRQARERADQLGLDVELEAARGESLPFDDGQFDVVVASFVFCTIPEPERALAEVARVLRPGGSFRFLEHVRAGGLAGRLHDVVAPAWHAAAGGCHLNRETGRLFRAHEQFELIEFQRSGRLLPIVRGALRKTGSSGRLRQLLNRCSVSIR